MKQKLLLFLSICTIVSCRNIEDPSTVDSKPVNFEENMDKTVKPGDNFFMYCNGTWWKKTDLGIEQIAGSLMEAEKMSNKRIEKLNDESIKHFWNAVDNIDNTSAAAIELIKKNLKMVENITTTEQAHDAIVNTMLAGYDNIIYPYSFLSGRKNQVAFVFPQNYILNFQWVSDCMTTLGLSDVDERVNRAQDLYFTLIMNKSTLDLSLQNIKEHPEVGDQLVALHQTKATGNALLNKVGQALGIAPEAIVLDQKMEHFYAELEKADPESVKCLLQSYICQQYKFTSNEAYNKYKQIDRATSLDSAMLQIKNKKMLYMYANAYATQYVSPELNVKMKMYGEDIRKAFSERIDKLDWMSATTKQKSKEKLDAMYFYIGYPDNWIESALPKLQGASLLEDILTVSRATNNLTAEIAKQPVKEGAFHQILSEYPFEVVNAMYMRRTNSITIFPSWMLEPMYDEKLSDACAYAIFTVFGHEITHGFDSKGAEYNKDGEIENWWTVADQMEFLARQDKLIACYDMLEIMPTELPTIYTDGRYTLAENMADLGGFLMAFEAYEKRLHLEGYKGEELKKQYKKFYQAYADIWLSKYSPQYVIESINPDEPNDPDVHALAQERVNGVVMNTDKWYDVYDVKWGDKLYLKPESRTYIW